VAEAGHGKASNLPSRIAASILAPYLQGATRDLTPAAAIARPEILALRAPAAVAAAGANDRIARRPIAIAWRRRCLPESYPCSGWDSSCAFCNDSCSICDRPCSICDSYCAFCNACCSVWESHCAFCNVYCSVCDRSCSLRTSSCTLGMDRSVISTLTAARSRPTTVPRATATSTDVTRAGGWGRANAYSESRHDFRNKQGSIRSYCE